MTASEFKNTYLPFQGTMYTVAFRILGNAQDAEDLVQETYMKLWQKRDSMSHECNLKAYCVTLTRNMCIDRLRRTHLMIVEAEPQEGDAPKGDSVEDSFIFNESEAALMGIIGLLPERQRRIMLMRDVEGIGYADIAAATGLSEVNVRVMLSRARKFVVNKLRISKKQ